MRKRDHTEIEAREELVVTKGIRYTGNSVVDN